MPKEFNHIYSKLVTDANDIIGNIAYSLYKQDKIEIIKKKQSDGIVVNDKTLKSFHEFSATESSIDAYKMKAELILQAFMDNALEEITTDIQKEAKEGQSQILQEIVDPLVSGFWRNFFSGLLSTFTFSLILAAIAFIIQFKGSEISISINNKHNETTKQLQAPPSVGIDTTLSK